MLPNLFIGGAAKSGTTTLHYWLNQHPEVYFPRQPQEIHYYDHDYFFKNGLQWFEKHFYGSCEEKIIAQTSPSYLYYSHVPERIFKDIPHAKFIFILRNPIDRAYSDYWMNVMYGLETLSFKQAIAKEKDRIARSSRDELYYAYLKRGLYVNQLQRFFCFFPRENILILLFDDLVRNGLEILRECSDFLEVDYNYFVTEAFKIKNYNPSKIPRIKLLQRFSWLFRKYLPLYGAYGPMKRLALPSYVVDFLNLKVGSYPPMCEQTRKMMIEKYRGEIEQLEILLDRNLDGWSTSRS